jgi:hypothetical protein
MTMQRKNKPNYNATKKGHNLTQDINTLSRNVKQLEANTQEYYAEIAIAICTNPDCVNKLSIMDLFHIYDNLYYFSHQNVPLNLIILAVGVIGNRLRELERQTGLNFGVDAPEIAEIESSKAFMREACKNAIKTFNTGEGWVYP